MIEDDLRAAMQIACACIVTEPAPVMQHLVDGRIGEGIHIGKARDEALIIRNDRRDLRLLQHDLRHPHAIRREVSLPRQVLAAVLVPPSEQVPAERRGIGSRGGGCRGGFFFRAHPLNSPFRRSCKCCSSFFCCSCSCSVPFCFCRSIRCCNFSSSFFFSASTRALAFCLSASSSATVKVGAVNVPCTLIGATTSLKSPSCFASWPVGMASRRRSICSFTRLMPPRPLTLSCAELSSRSSVLTAPSVTVAVAANLENTV